MAGIGNMTLRNITFIKETDDESSIGQSEFSYKQVGEEDVEAPVVFQCGRCKIPVGDSLSWVGSEDDQNQILLKRVTDNVVVGSEPFVSRTRTELGCLIVNLSCLGCSSPLGRVYTSTPRNLDYKRSLFCLSVENVDCYVLGSSAQKMLEDRQDEPVTFEYQANVDMQIGKGSLIDIKNLFSKRDPDPIPRSWPTAIKAITVSMAQRLLEIEAKLQNSETK